MNSSEEIKCWLQNPPTFRPHNSLVVKALHAKMRGCLDITSPQKWQDLIFQIFAETSFPPWQKKISCTLSMTGFAIWFLQITNPKVIQSCGEPVFFKPGKLFLQKLKRKLSWCNVKTFLHLGIYCLCCWKDAQSERRRFSVIS